MLKIHKWLQWPLWPPTMVQKRSFFVLIFAPLYKETDQGGNYSREETIQGQKLVSLKA